jgi:hypothetical protein
MELIIRELGSRPADVLKPKEIEDWLTRHVEWFPAARLTNSLEILLALSSTCRPDSIRISIAHNRP